MKGSCLKDSSDYLSNNRSVGQASMFPVTLEMSPSDYILLKEIEDDINILGFDFRHLGNNVISINSQPAESSSSNPGELLKIVLDVYKNTETDPAATKKEKIASAMARASAIPYGKSLDTERNERSV